MSGNGERKGNGKQPGDSAGQTGSDSAGNGEQDGGFDAIAAAAELAESLGETESEPASAEKMLELEVLELSRTLEERDRQLVQANQRAAAVEAEIERVKQRLEREGDRELETRTRKILLAFLEVLDDLDRALVSVREDVADGDATTEVVRGVELVRSSFLTRLGSFGVSHLPAAGQPFDPNVHDAMTTVQVDDANQDGVVVGVIREGYLIGDEVLRPAGVAVGRK